MNNIKKKFSFPEGKFVECPTCHYWFNTGAYNHTLGELHFDSDKCKKEYMEEKT